MNNAAAVPEPVVKIVNHQPMTTSIEVARFFGKEHHHVLKAIKKLELSEEFSQANFRLAYFPDAQGKKRPMYEMTRNGFAFVGLGFTGKQAAQFKEAYIKAFDLMEAKLRGQQPLAFLPAPPDDREIRETAQRDGFTHGLRFFLSLDGLRRTLDMDEQTLQTLCWFRSLGLTQDEAARLCIISKRECERVEDILRAHGVKTTVVNMTIRKAQIRDHWTDLITQAGLSGLPAPHTVIPAKAGIRIGGGAA